MAFQNGSGSGGGRSRQPVFNSPPVVTWMIAIMAGVWLIETIGPGSLIYPATSFLSFVPARLAYDFPASVPGFLISAVTYQFLHADFTHLALNSVWMLIFGTIVARRLELRSFVVFFIVCGVIGAAVHLILSPGSRIPVVGASGAISGLMGAAGRFAIFPPQGGWHLSMHAPAHNNRQSGIIPLSDRRLQAFAGVWIVVNLVFGLGGGLASGGSNQLIAWDIHIAGLLAGLLLFPKFDAWRTPPKGGTDGTGGDGDRRDAPYLRRVK